MFTFTDIALTHFSNTNIYYNKLFRLFRLTLNPDLTEKEFYFYYRYDKPEKVRITFIKHCDAYVGFISVSEYKKILLEKEHIICRVAVGLLSDYRNGSFPVGKLCRKIMHYKIQHPFSRMYLTGYIANPLVYAMICKYTGNVFPTCRKKTTDKINSLRLAVLKNAGMLKKEIEPFVMKIHFKVCLGYKDKLRIEKSNDKNVLYYLKKNPGYTNQNGLMVIVPVNWLNISTTIYKTCMARPIVKFAHSVKGHINYFLLKKIAQLNSFEK